MSNWLDLSNVSNKFNQSYFRGFIDISGANGGNINLRNDGALNIYNKTDISNPKFSIKSDQLRIYDGISNYYDVSNNKLIYLKNVSGDIQTQLNTLSSLTQYINSDTNNSSTILELDRSGTLATIYGNLKTTGKITGLYDLSINGNINIGKTLTVQNGLTVASGSLSLPANSISYTAVSGGVDTTTNQSIGGIKTFTNKAVFNSDISLNGQLFMTGSNSVLGNLSIGSTVTIQNGLTILSGLLSLPDNSIAANAIYGVLPYVDLTTAQNIYGSKTFRDNGTFTGTLNVNADTNVGGNIFTKNIYSISDASFGGNVTIDNSIFVLGDMSINGNILLGGDISINGNIHFPVGSINQAAIMGGGVGIYIGAAEKVTFDDDMFAVIKEGPVKGAVPAEAVFEKTISIVGDASFNGNVYMTNNIFIPGDVSASGKLLAVTQPISDNSTKVATTAFVQNQGYTTPQTLFRQFT